MRIVLLAWRDTVHDQAGGSEVVVDRLADGLTVRGHDVLLLHGGPSGLHRYRSCSTGGTYTQYLRAPAVFHRRARDADVVVDVSNGIPFFTPLWQRAPTVALFHHVHTEQWAMQFSRPLASVGGWLESRAVPQIYRRTALVSVSRSTTRALTGLGLPANRITTIEMGIDVTPQAAQRSDRPLFVVLGRLVPHKRVELAIEAWGRVRPEVGGELIIAGDGPELERLVAAAGSGVRFLGRIDERQKADLLSSAWMLIHPAHHEGWGTVIMEAAAHGTPTLGFDVEGVRDSVVDDVTGVLAGDCDSFTENWLALARDDDRRARLGADALRRAGSFTWTRAGDAFEQVLIDATRSRAD